MGREHSRNTAKRETRVVCINMCVLAQLGGKTLTFADVSAAVSEDKATYPNTAVTPARKATTMAVSVTCVGQVVWLNVFVLS